MLAEFGAIGALIAGYLIYKQLGMVFAWSDTIVYGLTVVSTIGYYFYCRSLRTHFDFLVHHHDSSCYHGIGYRWGHLRSHGRANEGGRLQWPWCLSIPLQS